MHASLAPERSVMVRTQLCKIGTIQNPLTKKVMLQGLGKSTEPSFCVHAPQRKKKHLSHGNRWSRACLNQSAGTPGFAESPVFLADSPSDSCAKVLSKPACLDGSFWLLFLKAFEQARTWGMRYPAERRGAPTLRALCLAAIDGCNRA